MIPDPVRLYNPKGPDRVAVVSAQPAWSGPGMYLIHVARGPRAGKFGQGTSFGPYPLAEVPDRFAEVLDALRAEGFEVRGQLALLEGLLAAESQTRARAAARLGWRRDREAVGPLMDALAVAVDDVCAILDALGAIGDPRAIPAVRPHAARKLLSRRRSAVEALRNLGDTDGIAEASARAREALPEPVRAALGEIEPDDERPESVAPVIKALDALESRYRGLALDTLYELATPAAVAAVRAALETTHFDRPYSWRYVKSIYKRSMLRHDAATFGWLVHAIEVRGRQTPGTTATVKSGYDGVERPTPIFRRETQNFARRLAWRYLRNLARYQPAHYAHAAAEVLAAYGPEDAQEPDGLKGIFAHCYLLHRVLWGASDRFVLDSRRLVFRFRDAKATQPPADRREEAYPELWDAQPRAYLRVLAAARLPEVQSFAVRAVAGRHRDVLAGASAEEVLPLLRAPFEPTVRLGMDELERRFDPERPDLILLDRLLSDPLPEARELGRDWLRRSAEQWTLDQEWVVLFLTSADPRTALLAAELAADRLRDDPAMRRELAARILDLLRAPEIQPGAHDAYGRIAREALIEEVDARLNLPALLTLILTGSPPAQALAGEILARRPEAVAQLGPVGLADLAGHEVAAVRAAAHALLRGALDALRDDPAPLFLLVESRWDDTRTVAFTLLTEEIGPERLGFGGLVGLLDSNRMDVQEVGKELVLRHIGELDGRALVGRLVEHPHPNMRRFALDLAVDHLPDGAEALEGLGWFFRAAVLDLWPERRVKRRVIDFLLKRGLRDERQAQLAATLLGEFVRLQGRADFERALEALVRLELAYSGLSSTVALKPEGVG